MFDNIWRHLLNNMQEIKKEKFAAWLRGQFPTLIHMQVLLLCHRVQYLFTRPWRDWSDSFSYINLFKFQLQGVYVIVTSLYRPVIPNLFAWRAVYFLWIALRATMLIFYILLPSFPSFLLSSFPSRTTARGSGGASKLPQRVKATRNISIFT